MNDYQRAFEFQQHEDENEELGRLVEQGKLHVVIGEDEQEKFYPTAAYLFEDLREEDLDVMPMREIAYTLESRGLLRLRRTTVGWSWKPTLAGRQAGLRSKKPAHEVLVSLGLENEILRICRAQDFAEEMSQCYYRPQAARSETRGTLQ